MIVRIIDEEFYVKLNLLTACLELYTVHLYCTEPLATKKVSLGPSLGSMINDFVYDQVTSQPVI